LSAVTHLLNQTATVRRRLVTDDGMGGQIVEWQTVDQIPVRVSSPPTSTTNAVLTAAQTHERVPFYVYFDSSEDIRRGDVLQTVDGRQLWVEAVTWPSVQAYRRAGCREWQSEITEHAPDPPNGNGGGP